MKYIVVLGDGMADEPLAALGGKTPLEYAKTPAMDALASGGEMGMVQTHSLLIRFFLNLYKPNRR